MTRSGLLRGPQTLQETQMLTEAARPDRRELVLVVDDNAVNRAVAVQMLEMLGFRSEQLSDGRAAVEWCLINSPDAVLMDVEMPLMNGLEATRVLRRLQRKAQISDFAIVALSGSLETADERTCLAAGMDAYLAKPIDAHLLERTLRRCIARRQGAMHEAVHGV
jgi:CheY-like chemotaxis protein